MKFSTTGFRGARLVLWQTSVCRVWRGFKTCSSDGLFISIVVLTGVHGERLLSWNEEYMIRIYDKTVTLPAGLYRLFSLCDVSRWPPGGQNKRGTIKVHSCTKTKNGFLWVKGKTTYTHHILSEDTMKIKSKLAVQTPNVCCLCNLFAVCVSLGFNL